MKKRQWYSKMPLFSQLRFQSIFLKSIFSQILLTIGVGILLFVSLQQIYQHTYEENLAHSGLSILEAVNRSVEVKLTSLLSNMNNLFQTESCNLLIVNGSDLDELLPLQTAQQLFRMDQQNDMIDRIWLHIARSSEVISSDRTILSTDNSPAATLFQQYEGISWGQDRSFQIIVQDQSVYLFLTFPQEKSLATLCVQVNSQALWETFCTDIVQTNGYMIYPYLEGQAMFDRYTLYPDDAALQVEHFVEKGENQYFCLSPTSNRYFAVLTSPSTGLLYLLSIPENTIIPNFSTFSSLLLPLVLIIGILLLLSSTFLVRTVYIPIHELLSMLVSQNSSSQQPSATAANELELFRRMYQEESKQKDALSHLLQQVGNEISEKLFHSFLNGTVAKPEQVAQIVQQIQSPCLQGNRYFVVALHWTYYSRTAGTVEQTLYGQAITYLCKNFWGDRLCCIIDEEGRDKILVCLDAKLNSLHALNRTATDFCEYINHQCQEFSAKVEIGCSNFCTELPFLSQARKEALDDLRRSLYYNRESGKNTSSTYLRKEIESVLNQVVNQPDIGENPLLVFLSCYEGTPLLTEAQSVLVDCLAERLIRTGVSLPEQYVQDHIDLTSASDRTISPWVRSFCLDGMSWLRIAAQREQYRHIEAAKQYIRSHYKDSTLSLDSVSIHCGISSSYLSRLFVTYEPPGFLNYLNQWRLSQACQLLQASQDTVAEIGFQTGFNSPQNFIRVFKRYYHETPGQYRSRHRKKGRYQ